MKFIDCKDVPLYTPEFPMETACTNSFPSAWERWFKELERIERELNKVKSVGRVEAHELKTAFNPNVSKSKRGKNLKPDQSKKAKYS